MKLQKILFALFIVSSMVISITSCKPKDEELFVPSGAYTQGIFIGNEGSYGSSNGSVSFFNRNTGKVENDIFAKTNGRPLGDVVQSVSVNNGIGYIVVNNSNKVEVVNSLNFQSIATINGFVMPRYFIALNNSKAYVSEWVSFSGAGNIKVIDLSSNTIVNTIPVGEFPENMLISGGKLYVTNSGDSTVMIINTVNDITEDTITVGHNPNSLVQDANNDIWVLCGGKKEYNPDWSLNLSASTEGSLVKINTSGNVLSTLVFGSKAERPSHLIINSLKNVLFYTYSGDVYDFSVGSSSLNSSFLIDKNFYGLGFDPVSNYIIGGQAKDFIQTDYFFRYNQNGTLVDSFNVGIAANGFAFN